MSKRNTKHSRRGKVRSRTAPMVVNDQDDARIAEFFGAHGLSLMSLAQMLSECKVKLNDLLAHGRSLMEWLLTLSAQSLAGPKSQRREVAREVVWHGRQINRVELLEGQLQVSRPRLRTKGPDAREVAIPAYEAIRRNPRAAARMSEILLVGVSRAVTQRCCRRWRTPLVCVAQGAFPKVHSLRVDTPRLAASGPCGKLGV